MGEAEIGIRNGWREGMEIWNKRYNDGFDRWVDLSFFYFYGLVSLRTFF